MRWLADAATKAGPSVSVHGWVAWVIVVGAVVFALTVIWKFIWPITRAAVQFTEQWSQITDALPQLLKLAEVADVMLAIEDRLKRVESKVEDLLAAGRASSRPPERP